MPKSRPPYPQEFREQIVELAKTGRTPTELSREFGCSAQTITNWIAQAAIDAGKPLPGKDGLTSAEREELSRLKVSLSSFYAWRERGPSQRSLDDAVMTERIRMIHAQSRETYGVPRVRAELVDQGTTISRKRVARLMRRARIRGVSRRRGYTVTTRRDARARPAPDLVNRRFAADGPNRLWVADMTYVPTWAGFVYLAIVLDVYSRRVVGWSIGEHMTRELVLAALNMALAQRRPHDVVHHSDQGSQYTSIEFGKRCSQMGVRPSMGSVGDAYDNAMAESFFASLECEPIDATASRPRRRRD